MHPNQIKNKYNSIMNPDYSNDPRSIGNYYSDSSLLVSNMSLDITAFDQNIMTPNGINTPVKIMETKPRKSVPEQYQPIGTKTSKSCNLPGIEINRFENPNPNIQNPQHIIREEDFRGGMPSRIVSKDVFFNNNKSTYKRWYFNILVL